MSEIELRRELGAMAAKNAAATCFASFLGAGLYAHHSPAFVSQLLLRGEFLTSYTPYQPEVSQGTLTAIWEFQSHMALLTGMDVANASMYEGASAFVEAILMAERLTKKRTRVVVSRTIHPEYLDDAPDLPREPRRSRSSRSRPAPTASRARPPSRRPSTTTTFAVAVQSPNVFGLVEDWSVAAEAAHAKGALADRRRQRDVLARAPEAAGRGGDRHRLRRGGLLRRPASFGGPLVGFLACRDGFKRQIPGRLAGRLETPDGPRLRADPLDARAAHPAREGDLEHLHEPGALRPRGDDDPRPPSASTACARRPSSASRRPST